jgi:23S rRNA pseudouridine1911/1915/1917 synthase
MLKPSSESTQTAVFVVTPEQDAKRLDIFLVSQMPGFSRTQVQALIEAGKVEALFKIKAIRSNFIVSKEQSFRVTVLASQKTDIPPESIKLDIVYEDRSIIVVNKSAGMVVHPGAGNPSHTLMNALVAYCPDIKGVGGVKRPGLVHRLDKDTSGLLVVAKTDKAFRQLVKQLKMRSLNREYLGIVDGSLAEKGVVEAAIGRHPTARKKMAVQPETGKPSVTHFLSLGSNAQASLLLLKLETGRTHQIRVHMAYIRHPILGDAIYGRESSIASRQMLHAFRLSFKHPQTGITRSFYAAPPKDFVAVLTKVNLTAPKWHFVRWKEV